MLNEKQGENQFCPPPEALSISIPCQETWALLQHPYKKKSGFWGVPIEISLWQQQGCHNMWIKPLNLRGLTEITVT